MHPGLVTCPSQDTHLHTLFTSTFNPGRELSGRWGCCSGPVVGIVKMCAILLLLYGYLIFRISCEVNGIESINKLISCFFQFIIAVCDLANQVDCCPECDTQTSSARNKQNSFFLFAKTSEIWWSVLIRYLRVELPQLKWNYHLFSQNS